MHHRLSGAAVAAALLLAADASLADDSSAALGIGGISFAKSDAIRMSSEDLFISPERVRVKFEFANESAKDVETLVAFPLPDLDTREYFEVPLGAVTDDPVNFVNFKVAVDGNPVRFEADQRAIVGGKDVTATVKSVGLPVNLLVGGRFDLIDKLSPAKKKVLEKAGVAVREGDYEKPLWIVRTRFFWKQRFPAGKTVRIEHAYQPVTGAAFFSQYEMSAKGDEAYFKKTFCMDPPTLSRIAKMMAAARAAKGREGMEGLLEIYSTEYVLKTGNNWKGPIGRFHLVLDKLKPANTLSLCWDEPLKKTSATRFEMTRDNYRPTRDVKMVVLK